MERASVPVQIIWRRLQDLGRGAGRQRGNRCIDPSSIEWQRGRDVVARARDSGTHCTRRRRLQGGTTRSRPVARRRRRRPRCTHSWLELEIYVV